MRYWIDYKLYGIEYHHEHSVIDKYEIANDDGACSFDVSEVANIHVNCVESIT